MKVSILFCYSLRKYVRKTDKKSVIIDKTDT